MIFGVGTAVCYLFFLLYDFNQVRWKSRKLHGAFADVYKRQSSRSSEIFSEQAVPHHKKSLAVFFQKDGAA